MLATDDRSSSSPSPGGRRSTPPTVLGWLRDPELLARVSEGVLDEEQAAAQPASWQDDSLSVDDVPLLDELRYLLGDVPDRRDGGSTSSTTSWAETLGSGREELTTASDREYGPGAPVWTPPTHRIEDDGYAHVLVDEAQDLTPDAVADGRPPRPRRDLDHRRRPGPVVVAGAGRVDRPPAPPRSRARTSTPSTSRPTTATPPRSTSFAAAYAARVGLDADLPTAVRSTGVEPARGGGR